MVERSCFTLDSDLYNDAGPMAADRPRFFERKRIIWITDWSPDGRCVDRHSSLTVAAGHHRHRSERSADGEGRLCRPISWRGSRASRRGRWLAFTSDESGRMRSTFRAFTPVAGSAFDRTAAATRAGRRDARKLFYVARDASLDVDRHRPVARPTAPGHRPRVLFKTTHPSRSFAGSRYVQRLDGQRFFVSMPAESSSPPSMLVTMNGPALLNAPTRVRKSAAERSPNPCSAAIV